MSPQRRAWLLLVAGSVLVLGCVAVLLLVPVSVAFGWFAYAPLSDTVVTPGFGSLDPTHRWAVVVGIAGLVAASWAAGFLTARRR